MPLQIIRNDITKVTADAIVNTANPNPTYGSGVDYAIYTAAGKWKLLAKRLQIGCIAVGDIAVTPAFALHATYLIHAVGPVWRGGSHGEREAVRSCYERSLQKAKELGCESIAFPLIATGTYGFPKDEALQIAVDAIRRFLDKEDMTVLLVVFDKSAFELSGKLFHDVAAYIDEAYVSWKRAQELLPPGKDNSRTGISQRNAAAANRMLPPAPDAREDALGGSPFADEGSSSVIWEPFSDVGESSPGASPFPDETPKSAVWEPFSNAKESSPSASPFPDETPKSAVHPAFSDVGENSPGKSPFADSMPASSRMPAAAAPKPDGLQKWIPSDSVFLPYQGLDDMMSRLGESFNRRLFRLIDERGLTDAQVYKRANIDRKLFSKIRCNESYKPGKKTVIALAIALRLSLDETVDLLSRAELALSPSSKSDLIIQYFISHQIYDIHTINLLLFEYDQPLLGA